MPEVKNSSCFKQQKIKASLVAVLVAVILTPTLSLGANVGAGSSRPGSADAKAIAEQISPNWQHDLDQSLVLAASEHKLVLVDLYTDWCGWCRKLDHDTYSNSDVINLVNSRFVPVKLNAEDGGQGEALAKRYQVRGYPCAMILESSGKLRGVLIYGYHSPKEFSEAIIKIANQS